MKTSIFKGIFSIAILTAPSFSAKAEDFPEAKIYSPLMGLSTFNTVCVTWEYQSLEAGPVENRMITITTPSGKSYTSRGNTEFVIEKDSGGSLDNVTSGQDNAITVSYYNQIASESEGVSGFTEKGIYTIVIPEGAITINGVPNPEVELTYNLGYIAEMEPATYELVYEDNQPYLNITWNNQHLETTRAAAYGMGGSLTGDTLSSEIELTPAFFSLIEEDTVLQVRIGSYTAKPVNYILFFPGGQLENEEGYVNADQEFEFSIGDAGIISISKDENNKKVFNLNGIKLKEGSEDINQLPAGIYIIGGKKVIIK